MNGNVDPSSTLAEIAGIPEDDRAAVSVAVGGGAARWHGLGANAALIIVDMTPAFAHDGWPSGWGATGRPCAEAISSLLTGFRRSGLPVIYTVPMASVIAAEAGQWLRGTESAETIFPFDGPEEARRVVAELEPRSDEPVLPKAKPSAFFGTQLSSILQYYRADTLVITGMTTSGCVRATVNDAFALNFSVTIPVECVADRSQLSHQVELFDMGAKYADLVHLEHVLAELAAEAKARPSGHASALLGQSHRDGTTDDQEGPEEGSVVDDF